MKMGILRFDISNLATDSDNSGATISLAQTWGNNRGRDWFIYALRDGHAGESWDEDANGTNGNDALSTSDSDTDRLPDGWELFLFILDGEDPVADREAILARQGAIDDYDSDGDNNLLESILGTNPNDGDDATGPIELATSYGNGADSDGLVSIFLSTQANGRWWGVDTKETVNGTAPALLVPNGTITEPANPQIIGVSFHTPTNTYSMTVTGLGIGLDYHVESTTDLSSFGVVVGSGFTAATDPQTINLTADEAVDPRQFFRIADGPEPGQ